MILRRWLASVRTRLRAAAAERELDDELRTHLEMAVEENLAQGMSEREAARAAHRDLGVVSAVKEAHHQADSLYWLDTLLQDLRYGARILRRSPRFTGAVVLVLWSCTVSDRPASARASRRRWWRAGATSGRCSTASRRTSAWSVSSPGAPSRRRCRARGYRRAYFRSSASRPSSGGRSRRTRRRTRSPSSATRRG